MSTTIIRTPVHRERQDAYLVQVNRRLVAQNHKALLVRHRTQHLHFQQYCPHRKTILKERFRHQPNQRASNTSQVKGCHDKIGEGIILRSEMEQNTEFVEVQFQGKHGKKRLSLDFAKLEKI